MSVILSNTINYLLKPKPKNWLSNQKKLVKTKNFRKPKHFWHKISYYRISKTSRKLSKTIRQAKKVFQVGGAGKNYNSPLCSESLWRNKDYKKYKNNQTISCW